MQKSNPVQLILLILGVCVLSASFILRRFFPVSDMADGLIKGIAIGLLVLSFLVWNKQKKQPLLP